MVYMRDAVYVCECVNVCRGALDLLFNLWKEISGNRARSDWLEFMSRFWEFYVS